MNVSKRFRERRERMMRQRGFEILRQRNRHASRSKETPQEHYFEYDRYSSKVQQFVDTVQ